MSKPKNLRPGVWITYDHKDCKNIPLMIEHGDQTFSFYTRKIHARAINGTEIDINIEDLDKVSIVRPPIEKWFTEGDIVKLLASFPDYAIKNGNFIKEKPYLVVRVGNKGSLNILDEEGRDSIFIPKKYFLHIEKCNQNREVPKTDFDF